MKAKFEFQKFNGNTLEYEWIENEITTDNLNNDSGVEWNESMLKCFVFGMCLMNNQIIRNFKIV